MIKGKNINISLGKMPKGRVLCPCQKKNCLAPACGLYTVSLTEKAVPSPKPGTLKDDLDVQLMGWLREETERIEPLLLKRRVGDPGQPLPQYLPKESLLIVDQDGNELTDDEPEIIAEMGLGTRGPPLGS